MKAHPLIWISLALNLALGAGIWLMPGKRAVNIHPAPLSRSVPGPNIELPTPPVAPEPASPPFRWDQIASDDLKIYRDNLRAAGCPEKTIREIIQCVANQEFNPRRQAILTSFQNQFWRLLVGGNFNRRQEIPRTEWGQALEALRAERQKLINDVLGEDYLAVETAAQAHRASLERQRSWLPGETRDKLSALEEKHRQELAECAQAVATRPDQRPTAEDRAQMQLFQQEFDEAIKKLLTPEQQNQLQLQEFDAANWADSLAGFEPTEDEWQAVTKLRSHFDQTQNNPETADPNDDASKQPPADPESKLNDDIKSALGAERFAEYQLAADGQFQEVRNITQRYGLPDSVATQAYQVEQQAIAQAGQVRNNQTLSADEQQSLLAAIQQETQSTLTQTLGEKVFSTYREYSGDWLQELVQL